MQTFACALVFQNISRLLVEHFLVFFFFFWFCFFGSSLFETGVVLAHFSLSVKLTFRNPSLKSLCNVSEQFLVLCFKILVDG